MDDLSSAAHPLPSSGASERGYDALVIEGVWRSAQVVPGNDPEIWRRDEFGAWIHRLAYRNRHSEFGWEIAASAFTASAFGIASLRPLQWQNYLDFLVAARSSVITADGLRNSRKLL
jgi:hypothetical protein